MKLEEILRELRKTFHYKEFIKEHPDSFFCAGFLIFDVKNKTKQIQLDFFIPKLKRMASFEFPFTRAKIHEDEIQQAKKQNPQINIDIDDIVDFSKKIISKNDLKLKITKIIAILQKGIWNLTCMDDSLGIVKIKLNAFTQEEIKVEKSNIMDFVGIKRKDN